MLVLDSMNSVYCVDITYVMVLLGNGFMWNSMPEGQTISPGAGGHLVRCMRVSASKSSRRAATLRLTDNGLVGSGRVSVLP